MYHGGYVTVKLPKPEPTASSHLPVLSSWSDHAGSATVSRSHPGAVALKYLLLLAVACMALVLASCSLVPPTATDGQVTTTVSVTGPKEWRPTVDLSLEIGDRAWAVSRESPIGIASIRSAVPVDVRLVSPLDCRILASFRAGPGTAHVIRFAADGTMRVEDWTGQGVDSGPTLNVRPLTQCPAGPRD